MEVGGTTDDGMITVEEAECIAACTEAPCLQVNYRYRGPVTPDDFDRLVEDLRAGRTWTSPATVCWPRVRQSIPAERLAGVVPPEQAREAPVWLSSQRRRGGRLMDQQMAVNGYIAHAPGYVHNDGPKLITDRFVHEDSFTLARYEATGGYDGTSGRAGDDPGRRA